jgi:hypothetical protein
MNSDFEQRINFTADLCYNAVGFLQDIDFEDIEEKRPMLECTAYQVAGFLTHYTKHGESGVPFDYFMRDLLRGEGWPLSQWKHSLMLAVEELGGRKC